MSAFDAAMRYYPYVFHPAVVVGGGLLLVVYREWARQKGDQARQNADQARQNADRLRWRVAAIFGAGVLAFVPTLAYALLTGQGLVAVTKGNVWPVDALVAGGIFVVVGTTWLLWRRFEWGSLVPGYVQALALVTVPYVALSPFWNVSGHVVMSLMPTLYVTLVARRFWPTLVIPVVMVPNRVYLDAHTWAQAVGAFVLTTILVVAFWMQTSDEPGAKSESVVS